MGILGPSCSICGAKLTHNKHYQSGPSGLVYTSIDEMIKTEGGKPKSYAAICITCYNDIKPLQVRWKSNYISKSTQSSELLGHQDNSIVNSRLVICPDCNKQVSKRAQSCPYCGCPISDIQSSNPEDLKPVIAKNQAISHVENKPKCPTCDSTSIEKISLSNKVGSVALVGIFALGRVIKTFKCNNCGHKW